MPCDAAFRWLSRSPRFCSSIAVLGLASCLATLFAFGDLRGNEYDVLPSAKQFVDRDWLPRDWYLNQAVGYRLAFNCLAGLALKCWSLPVVAVVGRLVIFLGFALGVCRALSRLRGLPLVLLALGLSLPS